MKDPYPSRLQLTMGPGSTRPHRGVFIPHFSHGPRSCPRSGAKRHLGGHPTERARNLVPRCYHAVVARRLERVREIENDTDPQGTGHVTR